MRSTAIMAAIIKYHAPLHQCLILTKRVTNVEIDMFRTENRPFPGLLFASKRVFVLNHSYQNANQTPFHIKALHEDSF